MKVSDNELKKFSDILERKLKEEFGTKHMSKNLIDTIKIEQTEGKISVDIPAQTYNMLTYQKEGVVVHTSHGSYASKLDKEGSKFFVYPNDSRKGSYLVKPGNHKDFVDRIVNESLEEWLGLMSEKYKVKSRTEL